MTADGDTELRGIQDVARELGVTQRTLRFYEDRGLIDPQRIGTMRVYTRREVARMHLILRGKRLGFSIREIKEFLDLYGVDPQHIEQVRHLHGRVAEHLADLHTQKTALEQTIVEMEEIEREAVAWLARQETERT
ncbi:MerR family transcriptional regulator [Sphingomonas nostoxanthinifaciens]|uniref:MerR family transcriptional regulator n=1 Tax=Sphingomonas nostoxanthinifaciens TaxID=2872652 RepID=UPI001CC1C76B|nr:MerR family DNA-binding transcriptional regulator [Sphingomonas nostoxanthinifaciens]UAK24506.1 MerR family DNA-binding transcriptional regulator [Sphingomonas nostoxanthinifaciens]